MVSDDGGLQRTGRAGLEPEGARGDRSQAEDRQSDRANVSGVAVQSPDHHAFHTGCMGLQSHQVTNACFIQAPAVVDYHTSPGAAVSNASRKESTLPACLAGQTRPARRLPGTTARKSADAQRTGTWARMQASARWAVVRAANRCCNIWWSMMMILPRGWSRA